jgi:hypothetical protein
LGDDVSIFDHGIIHSLIIFLFALFYIIIIITIITIIIITIIITIIIITIIITIIIITIIIIITTIIIIIVIITIITIIIIIITIIIITITTTTIIIIIVIIIITIIIIIIIITIIIITIITLTSPTTIITRTLTGVCEDGRVVMKTPALEIDEALQILKPLLHRCTSSLTVRNDLLDLGVYLMSHWILDFLMVRKHYIIIQICFIKYILLVYLIITI